MVAFEDFDEFEDYVCFDYRETFKTGATTKTYVISSGRVVEPTFKERSRSGAHGRDCYDVEDVEDADLLLTVMISNSGKHYCRVEQIDVEVDQRSIEKALELHDCPSVRESLARLLRKARG